MAFHISSFLKISDTFRMRRSWVLIIFSLQISNQKGSRMSNIFLIAIKNKGTQHNWQKGEAYQLNEPLTRKTVWKKDLSGKKDLSCFFQRIFLPTVYLMMLLWRSIIATEKTFSLSERLDLWLKWPLFVLRVSWLRS